MSPHTYVFLLSLFATDVEKDKLAKGTDPKTSQTKLTVIYLSSCFDDVVQDGRLAKPSERTAT